jgi:hypothetical protein
MTDWGKVADNAGDKTDADLAAGLDRLSKRDISGLFPAPEDKAKVEGLIKAINASSSYNERAAAFKAVAATLGGDALKMLKGAMLGLLLCLAFAPAAPAQEVAPAITAIDLNAPLADARMGLAWDGAGDQLGVAYIPLIYWVGAEAQEYATLNLGASDKLSNGRAGYLVSAGPRLDTLFLRLAGTSFAKKHLRFAILPPLQITISYITQDFHVFKPFLTVCTKFGGR